jgi:hypothetical protein
MKKQNKGSSGVFSQKLFDMTLLMIDLALQGAC